MPKLYVEQRAADLGLPIVDGKAPFIVTVTADDVVKAKKADSKHCALSRASMRLPGVNAAYFFRTTAYLEFIDRMVRFKLPVSVQKEIVSFDRAKQFAPGLYQLTPPAPAVSRAATALYRKTQRRKLKALQQQDQRSQAAKVSAKRRDLGEKIAKIAAHDPVNDTPEQRAFERKVAGIVGAAAPIPLKQKRHMHRTQYVRGMEEPK